MGKASSDKSSPRIVTYDIETAMNVGGYFGPTYDVNIAKVIQRGFVMGFAYKYLHERRTRTCHIWDFPLYKNEPTNDIEVIKAWRHLMATSHVVVGQNSDQFDNKVMYGRLIIHSLAPVTLPPSVDTKKLSKKLARYDSNKLDDLARQFGYKGKLNTNADLWWGCMNGDAKSRRKMVSYNKQDVRATEQVYLQFRPHAHGHPNLANILGVADACPRCGALGTMTLDSYRYTKTTRYAIRQCGECTGLVTDRRAEKTVNPRGRTPNLPGRGILLTTSTRVAGLPVARPVRVQVAAP